MPLTEKLYLTDPFLKEFSAEAIGMKILSGKTFAILDRTAFHPRGGGQPGDRGKIGDSAVLDTIENGGEILHEVASPVSLGKVSCSIDWLFRFPLMQLHTGEHLFVSRLKLIEPEISVEKVDFSPEKGKLFLSGELDLNKILEAESLVNSAIRSALPVKSHIFPTLREAKEALPEARMRDERLPDKNIRIVEIAGEDYSACSGTHLTSAKEIGFFKVLSFSKPSSQAIVEFSAGENALEGARILANNSLLLSDALRVEPEKILPTAGNQKQELLHLREVSRKLSSKLAEKTEIVPEKIGNFSLYSGDFSGTLDKRDLAALAETLSKKEHAIVLLFGGIERDFFSIIIAKSPGLPFNLRKLSEEVFPLVGGRGGGKPDFVTGAGKDSAGISPSLSRARELLSD